MVLEKNMMNKDKKRKLKILKTIPLIVIIIIAVSVSVIIKKTEGDININTIIRYTPDNIGLAVLVILSFFALKSLSFIIPLSVLYLSSGILFPPALAVLVSAAGLWITITIPYLIGFFYGKNVKDYIKQKYPDTEKIEKYQSKNTFFTCFITRIVGILPADVLSIYFGVCRIPYLVYSSAGVAGSLLSIVTTTLLGNKLKDPFSREFIIILICRIVLVIISFMINHKISSQEENPRKKRE